MKRVFLDTVGLIALWDKSDQWHPAARGAMQKLVHENYQFYSSDLVMIECGNAAARRPYRDAVTRMRTSLMKYDRLLRAHGDEIVEAWNCYANCRAGGAGIVDQFSFLLMRREGITEAFTNDEHFRAAGFVTLF